MTREEAARAFAERMGWYVLEQLVPGGTNLILDPMFVCGFVTNDRGLPRNDLPLPAPDAPLHEQMEFVGRVAEVCMDRPHEKPWTQIGFAGEVLRRATRDGIDPCHAALLAALAALERK